MIFEVDAEAFLTHYGTPRHSGRYPWGSGGDITQRNRDFLANVEKLRAQGLSEKEIADGFDVTVTTLRNAKSIARAEQKQADIAQAQRMHEEGHSNVEIGRLMGKPESSVRALLAPGVADRNNVLFETTNVLRNQLVDKEAIDIGKGVGPQRGISSEKLRAAVSVLEEEGYNKYYVKVKQLGTGQYTTVKVLARPEITYSELYNNPSKIKLISEFSDNGGRTFDEFQPPLQLSSKRIAVNYGDDGSGGGKADGVMYVRRGVPDVSLDKSSYAQVRVAVDGTHYMKGMAVYKDDLPRGVDVVFNTSKSKSEGKLGVMKKISDDPDNPFGAIVNQIVKRDPAGNIIRDADGKPTVTSAMNIITKEGEWEGWSKTLSAQMLSKQNPSLIKQQLDVTYEQKKKGLDEILELTNPAVRTKLLKGYSDALDSSAVHLEAAQLPRQNWQVIMPVNSLKDTDIYAPNFRNGERVALVRYPHGGTFEIPELRVNNNHKEAIDLLGRAKDAVGINSKVAQRLSGADFDGDFVMVIPNNRGQVKTSPALAGLKDFDPISAYPRYEGMPKMKPKTKQNEMGLISNLITDMSIKGAPPNEIAQAVRHSMVVIDAEKWDLNYKQSAIDNGIPQLKEKYQGGKRAGSATLISRAGSDIRVPKISPRRAKEGGPIDITTGQKKYAGEPDSYVNKQGKLVIKTRSSKRLAEEEDAFTLSSGTGIEKIYATHSNKLKALANDARKEMVNTPPAKRDPSAARVYSKEVDSLNAKLNIALRNAPLERQAQLIANTAVSSRRNAHPEMDNATLKKIEAQELIKARIRTSAEKQDIYITDTEWGAIQAGAISNSKLTQILDKANLERVKQLATPKPQLLMSSAKQRRAASMLANGYTQREVADALGVSLSTLKLGIE